jgi:hypothetical protein
MEKSKGAELWITLTDHLHQTTTMLTNMKNLLLILALFSFLPSVRAESVITATVTVTNTAGVSNGKTISVNGVLRTWTNLVTAANNQITTTNSIGAAATNMFLAFASYPPPNMTVSRSGTNAILLQSYAGNPNVVTLSAGWGTVSFATNPITSQTPFRGFATTVGAYEKTNVANGIVSFLSSDAATNQVPISAPAMALFLPASSLVGLTNYILLISTNGTNFTLATSNSLYTTIQWATNGLGPAAYHDDYFWQFGSANLTNWSQLSTNVVNFTGLSFIEPGTGNILLSNTNGTERLRANEGGGYAIKFEDGNDFLTASTAHDVKIKDHGGNVRLEINDAATDNGYTYLRADNGNDSLTINGDSDVVQTYSHIAFNSETLRAVAIGTVTNFMADVSNSGSSDTDRNLFTVPDNALYHDGDTFTRTIGLKLANNGSSKKVQVLFNATPVIQAVSSIADGSINVTIQITRDSSTSFRYTGSATTGGWPGSPGTAGAAFASSGSASGQDFTVPITFKLILTGTSSSDITAVSDRIEFAPSHDYAF